MKNTPSIAAQVESLKSLDPDRLITPYLGIDLKTKEIVDYGKLYSHIFTAKKHEIKAYLQENYSIGELIPLIYDLDPPLPEKELFALRLNNGYQLYTFDLGKFTGTELLPDENALWDYYVRYITSGWAFKFED